MDLVLNVTVYSFNLLGKEGICMSPASLSVCSSLRSAIILTGPQTETHTNFREGLIAGSREMMKDGTSGRQKE
ncbi:unnamed protein product [Leuciscus chuanchicus]